MIRKLEVEDITKLMYLDDIYFEELAPCELGEWVQFLIQNIDSDKFMIQGIFEDHKMVDYFVAVCMDSKPICNYIYGMYYSGGNQYHKQVIDIMIKWGTEKNVKSVNLMTRKPNNLERYGFQTKSTLMSLEI
jgi:hypothetical protein